MEQDRKRLIGLTVRREEDRENICPERFILINIIRVYISNLSTFSFTQTLVAVQQAGHKQLPSCTNRAPATPIPRSMPLQKKCIQYQREAGKLLNLALTWDQKVLSALGHSCTLQEQRQLLGGIRSL